MIERQTDVSERAAKRLIPSQRASSSSCEPSYNLIVSGRRWIFLLLVKSITLHSCKSILTMYYRTHTLTPTLLKGFDPLAV